MFIGTKAATVVNKDTLVFVTKTDSVGSAMDNDNKKNTYEFWKDGEKQVEIVDFKAVSYTHLFCTWSVRKAVSS